MAASSDSSARALDAALLAAAKALVGAWILHLGFTHVSDDDYARTVIAEQFAHAPRLDPSGTSWLPLPFWVEGGAMMVFGRGLATARGVAVVLGALSIVPVYLALRSVRVPRVAAVLATLFGMIAPWDAWLGVATVPEATTGALVAAAAISMSQPRARPWGAAALLAASLCRYEAWPVCAVFALHALLTHSRRGGSRVLVPAVAVAGPLLWLAWNAHAHDGPLHFVRRVTSFREAAMAGLLPQEKLLEVPRALVGGAGELLVLAALGLLAGLGNAAYRERWRATAGAMLVMVAFLTYGAVQDQAPTHHPERTLVALDWVLAGIGVDGLRLVATRVLRAAGGAWQMLAVGGLAAGAAVCAGVLASDWARYPGQGADELRVVQARHGVAYRDLAMGTLELTPCSYEHFALIAAFGAPERTVTRAATHEPMSENCPHVVVR